MDKLDVIIPTFVRLWFICLVQVLVCVILISYVTPGFLVILVPLFFVYMVVQVWSLRLVVVLPTSQSLIYNFHIDLMVKEPYQDLQTDAVS